jgi:hypothetical protein
MERWAANTLRVLGIVATSLVVLVGGLLLGLLSLCAWGGGFSGARQEGAAVGYFAALVVLLIGGIFVIALLGRGIAHSAEPAILSVMEGPGHGPPAGQNTTQRLIYAVIAAIVFAAVHVILNIVLWPASGLLYGRALFLVPLLLYQAPYALLLVGLARKPNRQTFNFALAIPAVLVLLTLYGVVTAFAFYLRSPVQAVLMLVGLALDCLVLWLAWRATRQTGIRLDAASLAVAGVAALVYFGAVQFILMPALYRFRY